MPIKIISAEDAKSAKFMLQPSRIKSTQTYNEAAELIRQGKVTMPMSVEFSPEELNSLGLKTPYAALKYCLDRVVKKYGMLNVVIVGKKNRVTMYRENPVTTIPGIKGVGLVTYDTDYNNRGDIGDLLNSRGGK